MEIWNNDLDEREASAGAAAIMQRHISEGDIVGEFEERLSKALGIPYVLAACNGTCAIMLACMAAGVGPGDEVIVPDLTFIATANAPKALGAAVIACEVEKDRPLLDESRVMELVTDKTKAVIPVHLNGRIACSKSLRQKLHERGIFVLDDACQAFFSGPKGALAGSGADIACFSFGITKTLAAGQGGAVATHDKSLYEKMKRQKRQGVRSVFECDEYGMPGMNFKMTDILAAVGLVQLGKLPDKILKMKKLDRIYREGLSDIEGIRFVDIGEGEFAWMTDIYCDNRKKVRRVMEDHGAAARPLGACLHTAPFIQARLSYENAKRFSDSLLYLPSGPDQELKNAERVIDIFRKNRSRLV